MPDSTAEIKMQPVPDRGTQKTWMRTQMAKVLEKLTDFKEKHPIYDYVTVPISGMDISLREMSDERKAPKSWPLDKPHHHRFMEQIRGATDWLNKVRERFGAAKLPVSGVFAPEVLKDLGPDEITQLKEPMSPQLAIETLERLAAAVFVPGRKGLEKVGHALWELTGKSVDTFVNTQVLKMLWRVRRTKYGVSEAAGKMWETLTRMAPLGTEAGTSYFRLKGERLDGISTDAQLGRAMACLVGSDLAYWRSVAKRQIELRAEAKNELSAFGKLEETVEAKALEKAQIEGIYPDAHVNVGLATRGYYADEAPPAALAYVTQKYPQLRDVGMKNEDRHEINPMREKVMFVGPNGDVLLIPASMWGKPGIEDTLTKWLIKSRNLEAQRRRTIEDRRETKKDGYTLWECMGMAGAGYGKTVDERYQAIKLRTFETKVQEGKEIQVSEEMSWNDAIRDTAVVIAVGQQHEALRSLSLHVPDVWAFDVVETEGQLKVNHLVSFKGHAIMDGMPHARELAAIIGDFDRRFDQGNAVVVGLPEGRRSRVVHAWMSLSPDATETVKKTIRKDRYWEGMRMLGRAGRRVDGYQVVKACKNFEQTTSVETDRRKTQFARAWVTTNISEKVITGWARNCGQTNEWVLEQLVKYVKPQMEELGDLMRITPAYVMSMAKLIVLSKYDIPADQLVAETHQLSGFVESRMGAAMLVLDGELAGSYAEAALVYEKQKQEGILDDRAYRAVEAFQDVLADRVLQMRSGTARVQAGNGLINSIAAYMEPNMQEFMSSLTKIMPGVYGAVPPANLVNGKGITSVLGAPKGRNVLDPDLLLEEALYKLGIHPVEFATVTEGRPGQALSLGVIQDRSKVKLVEKDRPYYDFHASFSANEPLLLRWLAHPDRQKWLIEVLNQSLTEAGRPRHIPEVLSAGDLRAYYRDNRQLRTRLQPVFDALTGQIADDIANTVSLLTEIMSIKPPGITKAVEPREQLAQVSKTPAKSVSKADTDEYWQRNTTGDRLREAMEKALQAEV